jgi:hypothetical protein
MRPCSTRLARPLVSGDEFIGNVIQITGHDLWLI